MGQVIAIVCAVIAIVLTPVYLIFFGKGIHSLDGIRKALNRPIHPKR